MKLNLRIIDEAFGRTSDLYDILGVKATSSPEKIQRAFLMRRDKIDLEAMGAEKEMDAVVLTGRILTDPDSRNEYDRIRSRRIKKRRESPRGVHDLDQTIETEYTAVTAYDDEATVDTLVAKRDFLGKVADEVVGIVDDTSRSFEQVFSVFTLRDEDIDAVSKRIRKAERELARRL